MNKLLILMLLLLSLTVIAGCAPKGEIVVDDTLEDTITQQPVNTAPIQEETEQLIDENEDVDIGDVI